MIKELEENGYNLTCKDGDKDNVFSFLGVIIKLDKDSKMLVVNQNRLINNILETFRMSECNTQGSPTKYIPLRTDAYRPHRKERYNYASVI